MNRFDASKIDEVFTAYKTNPTEENLDNLYNAIDYIVVAVTCNIASSFSKKHVDDFMDLQQNVRISIYRILPKLANISVSSNQVIAIIVKAVNWSFKSRYAAYKRKTPVQGSFGDWMPENDVPVEIQLEMAMGGILSDDYSKGMPEENFNSIESSVQQTATPRIWINSNQWEKTYLKALPTIVLNKALQKNRFKEHEDLVRFCITCFIEDRDPSSMLISKKWGEVPSWWIRYSTVLFRLSILEVIK